MLRSALPIGVGIALIIGSGYGHGVLTHRWKTSPDIALAAAKLDRIPHLIEGWHSRALEMSARELEVAEVEGYFARAYRNDEIGAEVHVMVLCGPQGPISVHSPTICFPGAGYQQTEPVSRTEIETGDVDGAFFKTVFTKATRGHVEPVRTYWAWSEAGDFEAPDNPRIEFAGSDHLYKIYVTRTLSAKDARAGQGDGDAICEDFLKSFLPIFRTAISETPAG